MRFYIDECLPPDVADYLGSKRSHRAVHASRDLGFAGREDEWHIAEAKRRREILVTSNDRDFTRGFSYLRRHPGIVVFKTGAWTNTEDLIGACDLLLSVFRMFRIGAKPPFRNTLEGKRLVVSATGVWAEDEHGERMDI